MYQIRMMKTSQQNPNDSNMFVLSCSRFEIFCLKSQGRLCLHADMLIDVNLFLFIFENHIIICKTNQRMSERIEFMQRSFFNLNANREY